MMATRDLRSIPLCWRLSRRPYPLLAVVVLAGLFGHIMQFALFRLMDGVAATPAFAVTGVHTAGLCLALLIVTTACRRAPRVDAGFARELTTLRNALNAHAIVSLTDAHGTITAVNERFCQISGYAADELVGHNHRILRSDAHEPAFYAGLWHTIGAGHTWHGVIENRRKNGSPYWVKSTILPLRDAGGDITGYLSLRTDVTFIERQRRALQILSEPVSGDDREQAIAHAIAYAREARAAAVVMFEPAAERLRVLGYWNTSVTTPPPEFPLRDSLAADLAAPCDSGEVARSVSGDLQARFPADPLLDANTHQVDIIPLRGDGGEALGALLVIDAQAGSTKDDSLTVCAARCASAEIQRRHERDARNAQRAWLELVVAGANAGVWDWDVETDEVRFNGRWANMLGYELDALQPALETWLSLVHPDDLDLTLHKVREHLAGRSPFYESEHRMRHADGSWRWLLDRGMVTVRDPQGRPARMSGIHLDMTTQREEQALIRAEQARFALILEHTPVGLWEWDLEDDTFSCSAPWLTRLGYDVDTLPRTVHDWRALIHADDLPRILALKEAHLADESVPYLIEYRVAGNDGKWRWILSRACISARHANGRPRAMSGVHIDINEQRAAQQELRDQSRRLDMIIATAGVGLWEWHIPSGDFKINAELAAMLGCAPEDITHIDAWKAVCHPDEMPAIMAELDGHLAGNTPFIEMEARAHTADGDWLWMLSRSHVVQRDGDGQPLRMIGMQLDITARKRVEHDLATNQARLELVLEGSEVGMYEWDIATGAHHVDERWAAMLGYRPSEIPPDIETWRALVHPDDLCEIDRQLGPLLAGEADRYSSETRLRARDGSWIWVLDRGAITARDEEGRALVGAGIHLDITDRKRAEAALAESEARLRVLVDNSPIGIFTTDEKGRVNFCNPSVHRMLGSNARDDLNEVWARRIDNEQRATALARWRDYLANPDGEFDDEYRMHRTDGSSFTAHIRIAPVRAGTEVRGFVGITEDVTAQRSLELEQERMRRQMQQAQKMESLGQLTGGVAHDFNNILCSVLGFAALAQRRLGDTVDGRLEDYLQAITSAGERGRDLVAKMLAFSRSDVADAPSALEPCAVVQDALNMLAAVIPSSITLDEELAAETPPIMADRVELHQAVVNLVVNARDAISEHGHIHVALQTCRGAGEECDACHRPIEGEFVELVVSDDGSGIDAAHIARVFEPFFTTKQVGRGTGLGLAVIHGVTHRAGGHVRLTSRPGQGTVVRLLFPRAAEGAERTTPTEARGSTAPSLEGVRVLVADDEPLIRRLLSELLMQAGAHVTTAPDGNAAQRVLQETAAACDVLVTDQTMPGMTGTALIEKARELRPHLAAVLLSGFGESHDIARLQRAGVRFLPKPIDETLLLDVIAELAAADHATRTGPPALRAASSAGHG